MRVARTQCNHGAEARAGLNYLLIVASACYLESILEHILSELIAHLPNPTHPTDKAMRRALLERVRSASVREKAGDLFAIVTGQPMSKLSKIAPNWAGIDVLFGLRNMLAHGNPIKVIVNFPGEMESLWLVEYKGVCKKVHDYLLAENILTSPVDPLANEWFFLIDGAADHFWDLAYRAVVDIGESLPESMAAVVRQAVYRHDQLISCDRSSSPQR